MLDLQTEDELILRAAVGWLELEAPREALRELELLPAPAQDHPHVLEVRWMILAHLQEWDEALGVSRRLIKTAPQSASSWLNHAYATRRATGGGIQAAFEILANVATEFEDEPTIPYNLACYCCQLQKPVSETMQWFEAALKIGQPKRMIEMGLRDPDLAPIAELLQERARQYKSRAR